MTSRSPRTRHGRRLLIAVAAEAVPVAAEVADVDADVAEGSREGAEWDIVTGILWSFLSFSPCG